jgi:hypothetical protein
MVGNSTEVIQLTVVSREKRIEVIRKVKTVVDQKLAYLMEGLQLNVADALFEEMRHLEEQEALRSHFNIMRAIKVDLDRLLEEQNELMNLGWTNIVQRKDRSAVPAAPGYITSEIKPLCDKHLGNYRIIFEEIDARLAWLARCPITHHPLQPEELFLCFWYATEKLQLTEDERRLLLPLFNRFVLDRLGQLLSVANQSLTQQDIPTDSLTTDI